MKGTGRFHLSDATVEGKEERGGRGRGMDGWRDGWRDVAGWGGRDRGAEE